MSILVGDSGHEKAFTLFLVPNLFIGSVLHTDQTTNYVGELLSLRELPWLWYVCSISRGEIQYPIGYGIQLRYKGTGMPVLASVFSQIEFKSNPDWVQACLYTTTQIIPVSFYFFLKNFIYSPEQHQSDRKKYRHPRRI